MSEFLTEAGSVRTEGAGEERYDAVVVGAGSAGLSAALVLGGGEPRNAPAAGVHGFFTRDGESPARLLEIGREQFQPYGGVEYRTMRATEASGSDGSFWVVLEGGETVQARKFVLATGGSSTSYPTGRDSGSSGVAASTTARTATAGRCATGRWRSWRGARRLRSAPS